MIGNDIIDIAYTKASTNWQRPGWLAKVCTDNEIELVQRSINPFETVWRIWSMKESAYKVYIQKGNEHKLNPSDFHTNFVDDSKGEVQIENIRLATNSDVDQNFISTYAYEVDQNQKSVIQSSISAFESESVEQNRVGLLKHIARTFEYRIQDLSIQSDNIRIPLVYFKDKALDISISMSHHGKYAAYAFTYKTIRRK